MLERSQYTFTPQVAVYSNVRTTIGAQRAGWASSFNVAFRAGSVMGFALTGMAILVLYIALWCYRQYFGDVRSVDGGGGWECSMMVFVFDWPLPG